MILTREERLKRSKSLRTTTSQAALNQILFQPSAMGVPFVLKDDKEAFVKGAYENNALIYSIINLITRAASVVPWVVYEVTDEKSFSQYKRLPSEIRVKNLIKSESLKRKGLEEVVNSKLAELIQRPNPEQGQAEFIENALGFKLITGDSYIHGVEADSVFQELYVMPAHITEIISSGRLEDVVKGYKVRGYSYDITLPYESVLHIKYWNPDYQSPGSHLYGMSPLRAARSVITQSNDTYTANQRALQNMGAEGMLALDEEGNITPEQLGQLQQDLKSRAEGPENYKKILINTMKWKWVQFGISPVDLNIIESQKMSMRDLCSVYGISSELLNDPDNKTNTNKKESRKSLYEDRVLPELDSLRDELNRWLVPAYSKRDGIQYYIDYDMSAIPALADDLDKISERIARIDDLTPNEKREALGYGRIDDEIYDRIWYPMNKVPVDGDSEKGFTDYLNG